MGSRLRIAVLALIASFFLSGCVNYDVGVNFSSQTSGEIVQQIRLGEQLTSFSDAVAQAWLQSIQKRSRSLGGRTRRINPQELLVKIPFSNGAELAEKFNAFFQPVPQSDEDKTGIPELRSQLHLSQNNFLLIERDRLRLDVDLRPLSVISANGNVLISPGELLTLQFRLNTPWGAKQVEAIGAEAQQQGKQLVWKLKSGAENHLEAVFWVPSSLGIGTVAIALLVLAGFLLHAQLFPSVGLEDSDRSSSTV
ncbi:DUF3153 domain-containing protein [Microcoleus sp. FACHB-1515]|uniref:DUF3153 domain-containing protein n=1 Tax=Cyanophyceae TaxID=3028117 RepID=UPI00168A3C41|nr:DUF3153 domain-containing protein [Microcoleus sp. FACHB-1515]MBD2091024.1 DUF3153 domain-containing protein [Microcoleus sp. FACHB-1515]